MTKLEKPLDINALNYIYVIEKFKQFFVLSNTAKCGTNKEGKVIDMSSTKAIMLFPT